MAQRQVHFDDVLGQSQGVLMDQVLMVVHPTTTSKPFAKEKAQVRVILTATHIQVWKKNKKKRLTSAPISLCWLADQVGIPPRKDLDLKACFELVEPAQRWRLATKNEIEKLRWVQNIEDAIKSNLKCVAPPAARNGVFDFGYGIYDGEWLVGHPHGKGRFTAVDGTIFSGDWSSIIAAGYGLVTVGPLVGAENSEKEQEWRTAGWETFFPEEAPREAHNDVLDSSTEHMTGLTELDVEMLVSNATTRKYGKGDVILHEGEVNDCLYRIKSGIISLIQDLNGVATQKAEMGPDQMFGEMSVLDKNIISATVIAASDMIELYTIDLDILYELFKTCPGFSKRFHHAMAETLAARLMRFFSPKTRVIKTTFSGAIPGIPNDTKSALGWIEAWNTRNKTSIYYLDLIVYRDPWVSAGIEGKADLAIHVANLQESGRYWTWEECATSPTPEGFRILCKVQLTSQRTGAVTREDAVVEVHLNRKENKFKSISIHFDKEKLSVGQPVSDVRTGSHSPSLGRVQDVKYRDRFNLRAGETVLAEKVCVLSAQSLSSNVPGTLYVSSQYVCFYSKVFGMKTKEVIPIKAIKSVKKKTTTHGMIIKYNAKAARKLRKGSELSQPAYDKNVEIMFTFPGEFEENFAEINNLINKTGPHAVKTTTEGKQYENLDMPTMDGFRVAAESVIQKFARCSSLHQSLPELAIRKSMNEHGVRITGPNLTETIETYGTDLSGRTVSSYPRLSHINAEGKVVVQDPRQGDPICDQFCIERLENKAIFAIADGCAWGVGPKRAALLASRTFCEFVKHNLSAMTNLQEAGRLFLHAFAAAHHRIVEGFENKIWDCGTTTLLGGSILELAPSDKFVERRWGIVLASIGDCKGFLVSAKHKSVIDITLGSRTGNASVDASDCGGRLGPYVGEGNPDLRNLSLFYTPAEEGDVVIFTSDGVYDNLDPQSLGVSPTDFGLPDQVWDQQPDLKRVEEIKTEYVCEKIRTLIFGEKTDTPTTSPSPEPDASSSDEQTKIEKPKVAKLDTNAIVETLIEHALQTTKSSRDFMESYPDKILPKDYKAYPGKVDHTTCVALKVKRSTFKPIENELDTLVLRMRNPAQGLSTVVTRTRLDLSGANRTVTEPTVVPLTRGEGIESPRYRTEPEPAPTVTTGPSKSSSDPALANPAESSSNNTNSTNETAASSATSETTTSAASPSLSPSSTSPTTIAVHTKAERAEKKEPPKVGMLKRSNTILNVAIRGSVILRWLKENEKFTEDYALNLAQHMLNFRYIRPMDVESWRNETFAGEMSYNFQVYEPIMTRVDWEQLLKASSRVTYPKDTVIVKEGSDSRQRLYYIISGKCRTVKSVVEKKTDKKSSGGSSSLPSPNPATSPESTIDAETIVINNAGRGKLLKKSNIRNMDKQDLVVNVMGENETFGEISFLYGQKASSKASASVIADEDVDLYIIEGSWINILFVKHPGMAGRFYHYLASVLAHRLKKQEILAYQRTTDTQTEN